MTTTYQLWDNASGNLIEDYYTEREALDYVVEEIETYGADAVHAWEKFPEKLWDGRERGA